MEFDSSYCMILLRCHLLKQIDNFFNNVNTVFMYMLANAVYLQYWATYFSFRSEQHFKLFQRIITKLLDTLVVATDDKRIAPHPFNEESNREECQSDQKYS